MGNNINNIVNSKVFKAYRIIKNKEEIERNMEIMKIDGLLIGAPALAAAAINIDAINRCIPLDSVKIVIADAIMVLTAGMSMTDFFKEVKDSVDLGIENKKLNNEINNNNEELLL